MRIESKRGPKRKIKRKKSFINWKVYLSFYYYFITPFPLHFKDDF
jgi:hypothetical protein